MRPSHAGGVVVRTDGGSVRFLVVSAKRQPDAWVLPKGHIDEGESPASTATREVLEEAGIVATVGERLGTIEFETSRGEVRALFFLMRYERDGEALEQRKRAWLSPDEAVAALGFDDMRDLIRKAHALVSAG